MVHYVCPGECKGVSLKPLSCQLKTCSKHGKPLVECNCDNGMHDDAFGKSRNKVKP